MERTRQSLSLKGNSRYLLVMLHMGQAHVYHFAFTITFEVTVSTLHVKG